MDKSLHKIRGLLAMTLNTETLKEEIDKSIVIFKMQFFKVCISKITHKQIKTQTITQKKIIATYITKS